MNAVTEPAPAEARWSGLGVRAASAAVLVVPVLAAVYFGSPWFTALIVVAAVLMGWEWAQMCNRQTLWLTGGLVYIAVPCGALIWLRGDDHAGMITIFWLFAVVWTADIGAYLSGRAIGGPKLAPRISPKKTWAGFIGGISLAGLVAASFALAWEGDNPVFLGLWGVIVAIASQVGDLFESAAKRHFGVKDSSNLIPGHGGILDRVDALVVGAVALAAMKLLLGKAAMPWL